MDALEADPYSPRQQPASVLMAMLRLMDSLLPVVRSVGKCGGGCEGVWVLQPDDGC